MKKLKILFEFLGFLIVVSLLFLFAFVVAASIGGTTI